MNNGKVIPINKKTKPNSKKSLSKSLSLVGLFVLFFVGLSLILAWKYFPSRKYQEGVVSPRDILAPRDFKVINETATREAQSRAMNSVKPVYKVDPFIVNQADLDLKKEFEIFRKLRKIKKSNSPNKTKREKALKAQLPIKISDSSIYTFVGLKEEILDQMEIITRSIVAQYMQEVIKKDNPASLKHMRKEVYKKAFSFALQSSLKKAVAELSSKALRPNSYIDWEETSRLRQERKSSVKPVMITIKKGQVIVSKGQIITPEHIRILDAMGIQRSHLDSQGLISILIFNLMLCIVFWYYIKLAMPEILKAHKKLLLVIIIVLGDALLCSLLVNLNPFLTPVPIAAILVTILINPQIAFIISGILSIIVGVMTGEIQFFAVSLITSFTSILASWKVTRRFDLIATSVLVFFANAFSVAIFSLMKGETVQALLENVTYGGINGFFSGIIAIGLLPLLEHSFSITTSMRYLELSNQSEPLIKQLLMEAPGTYHHSVIVGNLAEAGAEAVGEDPLLCRVASYYHDIGKLKRPYFFVENQLGENPHDKLSPNLSALIITSHTKDGLELAKKHKLPPEIQDIILQHHGTSIVSYFYHKAKQMDGDTPLAEKDFRYSGPKPQTKAAAIVMLADAVEAAARTLKNPTPQAIEGLVQSLFKKFLDDGQLNESPLSLRDINSLMQTFSKVLTGIYHHRIEYPDQIIKKVDAHKNA